MIAGIEKRRRRMGDKKEAKTVSVTNFIKTKLSQSVRLRFGKTACKKIYNSQRVFPLGNITWMETSQSSYSFEIIY